MGDVDLDGINAFIAADSGEPQIVEFLSTLAKKLRPAASGTRGPTGRAQPACDSAYLLHQ